MADTQETEQQPRASESKPAPAESEAAPAAVQAPPAERSERKPAPQGDRPPGQAPQGQRREGGRGAQGGERRDNRGPHGGREGAREGGRDRGDDRRGDRPRFEGPPEIDIDKLISDPLYLDNQAHGVVGRMRDMDSGTKSQLRRLYNAVRRAVRTPENERQQQFVMLRARLAYTIARHSLRSLDPLEKLLLQVTRKNEARGYERFRDLFEAIVAYNE
jgi:CRISPR type III-A-associated protein Csm2